MTKISFEDKQGQPVALCGVRIHAEVCGMAMQVTMEQRFVNRETEAIEAIYSFPLDADGAVCGFEVETNGRYLSGRIDEKKDAEERYERAISSGSSAFMLSAERPDVFMMEVGNLDPGQEACIRIRYLTPVHAEDGELRLEFPTCIGPRYCPDPLGPREEVALNPLRAIDVPYGLQATVAFARSLGVNEVSSPTHFICQEESEAGLLVSLRDEARMDAALVLAAELPDETSCSVCLAHGPDEATYAAVTFVPEFDFQLQNQEVWFVVDCSGSMDFGSIDQARSALELCLRTLNPGDTFNICCFGSNYRMMSPHPIRYDAPSLSSALEYVSRIRADLGGTEVLGPLREIMSAPRPEGQLRQIVLMTDGQVANEHQVIEFATGVQESNRVFAFGIGPSASRYLVSEIARVTGGSAEFIAFAESFESKVLRVYSRLSAPRARDVRVDWAASEAQVPAARPPAVFAGDGLTVYARIQGALPEAVTLHATVGGEARQWSLPLQGPVGEAPIAALWAKEILREPSGEGVFPRLLGREQRRRVALSQRYAVLCAETAFCAVEHRSAKDANLGLPAIREIPTLEPRMLAATEGYMAPMEDCSMYAPAPLPLEQPPAASCRYQHCNALADFDDEPVAEAKPVSPVLALIRTQTAEGAFDIDEREPAVAQELAARGLPAPELVQATFTTLLELRAEFVDEARIWRRAARKATAWLVNELGCKKGVIEDILCALESRLRAGTS